MIDWFAHPADYFQRLYDPVLVIFSTLLKTISF